MKKPVIGIVGPVGSGKTTLAEGLAKHIGLDLHLEKPGENPYLTQFYDELRQGGYAPTALKSQLFFLLAAHNQAQYIAHGYKKGVAWDVPFYGHKMYADLLFEQQTMSTADYELYCQTYELCLSTSLKPDVLVVITTDIDTLQARIKQRGRIMELATPAAYWQRQIKYWQQQLMKKSEVPMIHVDSAEINWSRAKGVKQVWEKINQVVYA